MQTKNIKIVESCDIECWNCGKFLFTEERDSNNEIHCVNGKYEDNYYSVIEDAFYCKECAEKLNLNDLEKECE